MALFSALLSRIRQRFGLLAQLNSSHLIEQTCFDDRVCWYRFRPDKPIKAGWYMLSARGHHDVLGHDLSIRVESDTLYHLQIGARVLSKRIIRFDSPIDTLEISLNPGAGAPDYIDLTLTRLSSGFARSRMLRKLSYGGGYVAIEQENTTDDARSDNSGEMFRRYNRLLERHVRKIEYSEWRRLNAKKIHSISAPLRDCQSDRDHKSIAVIALDHDLDVLALAEALDTLSEKERDTISVVLNTSSDTAAVRKVVRAGSFYNGEGALDCEAMDQRALAVDSDYVLLLGKGVRIDKWALRRMFSAIAAEPKLQLVYADSDCISSSGERIKPSFKPEWNVELLRSGNYVGRFFLVERQIMNDAGGLVTKFSSSMEYDLLLRLSVFLNSRAVQRIPHILFSRTESEAALVPWVAEGSHDIPVLEEHISLTGIPATLENGLLKGTVMIDWALPAVEPSVDIIIPTRDRVDLLRTCIESILEKTSYRNYKITVVDNDSREPETKDYYSSLARESRFNLEHFRGEFNYSAINNHAVSRTSGAVVVLLNNDTEVIDGDWLRRLVAQCSRPEVGCVGAKLYYSSGLIQHAGVIIGVKGVAGHAHRFAPRDDDGYCGRLKMSQNVSAVTAACLAVRRVVYEQVAGLDEINLKVAYNDVDFCLRVAEAGYQNIWTPFVELYHHESVSRGSDDTSAKARRFQSEFDYMKNRWGTHLVTDPAYNPNLAHDSEDFSLAA